MRTTILALSTLAVAAASAFGGSPGTPNPFYAMDTCTKRPYPKNDITPTQQLELLKDLGYAGIAWTEEEPEQVKAVLAEAESRKLRMFAIYCAASVTPEGELSPSPLVEPLFEVLRGHGTLVWLHIGGKGPKIGTLARDSPAIRRLQTLAEKAEACDLSLAIYPHVGEWTERVSDAVRIARLVDRKNFGVTFNLCHCLAMGDEAKIPELLKAAAPYLKSATLNGADAGVKGPQWNRLIQTLDHGTYDVGQLLTLLRQAGFEGPVGLQGYGLGGDRRDNLARSLEAWRRLSAAR